MLRRKLALLTVALAAVAALVMAPAPAHALFENSKEAACGGIQLSDSPQGCTNQDQKVNSIISTGISLLSFAIGVVAIIMIIVAGIKFVTAQGDSSSIASARTTVLYAIVGLVVAAMAQALVRFVLLKANGR